MTATERKLTDAREVARHGTMEQGCYTAGNNCHVGRNNFNAIDIDYEFKRFPSNHPIIASLLLDGAYTPAVGRAEKSLDRKAGYGS